MEEPKTKLKVYDIDRTYDDPVVKNLHETRHRIMARFGDNLSALFDFLQSHPVPGAKYVNPGSAKSGFSYSSVLPPDGTGVLVACEPKP